MMQRTRSRFKCPSKLLQYHYERASHCECLCSAHFWGSSHFDPAECRPSAERKPKEPQCIYWWLGERERKKERACTRHSYLPYSLHSSLPTTANNNMPGHESDKADLDEAVPPPSPPTSPRLGRHVLFANAAAASASPPPGGAAPLMGAILRRKKVVSMPLGTGGDFFVDGGAFHNSRGAQQVMGNHTSRLAAARRTNRVREYGLPNRCRRHCTPCRKPCSGGVGASKDTALGTTQHCYPSGKTAKRRQPDGRSPSP